MRFFKIKAIFFVLAFALQAKASDLLGTVVTRELGACETNNLSFTAMKFYKIPLEETYEDRPVHLRILFFFNDDYSVVTRLTKQALISCQTLPSGDEACAYRPLSDQWLPSTSFSTRNLTIKTELGQISWINPENSNRGFQIKLNEKSFNGGMVQVNFNQFGVNAAKICSP